MNGRRFAIVLAVLSIACQLYGQLGTSYPLSKHGGNYKPYKMTFFSHDAFHPRWSPDGEWIAYISNQEGLPQLALLETYGGKQITVHITDRRYKRPMGILSVTTREAGSGEVTGSRIHLEASDGKFYAPVDAYARVSRADDHIFHTPGRFTVRLPVGKASVTVVKGFEYWPQDAEVDIEANEVTSLVVDLKPMTDMAAKGWYSGSTHVHMNYAGNLHNTLENLMMMSEAEDQDIVNEQIANKDNRILDYQFFVPGGGPHPMSTPDRVLVVGQKYRPPFYGHVFMFGMEDHLISPYTTGYEGTAIESLYPSNTDMFRKAKAQGATVGYVHAFSGDSDPLEGSLGGAKGFMVDAALGTTDAVEWSDAGRAGFYPVYGRQWRFAKECVVGFPEQPFILAARTPRERCRLARETVHRLLHLLVTGDVERKVLEHEANVTVEFLHDVVNTVRGVATIGTLEIAELHERDPSVFGSKDEVAARFDRDFTRRRLFPASDHRRGNLFGRRSRRTLTRLFRPTRKHAPNDGEYQQ